MSNDIHLLAKDSRGCWGSDETKQKKEWHFAIQGTQLTWPSGWGITCNFLLDLKAVSKLLHIMSCQINMGTTLYSTPSWQEAVSYPHWSSFIHWGFVESSPPLYSSWCSHSLSFLPYFLSILFTTSYNPLYLPRRPQRPPPTHFPNQPPLPRCGGRPLPLTSTGNLLPLMLCSEPSDPLLWPQWNSTFSALKRPGRPAPRTK